MEKREKILYYLKKYDFFTVTAICIIVVGLVSLGFLASEKKTQDTAVPSTNVSINNERPNQTDGETDGLVAFSDQAMKLAVAKSIGVEANKLSPEMLENVTRLYIEKNPDIASLEDLALMPNLESLTISGCSVKQLQPITQLEKLTVLNLSGNEIVDISQLASMTQLKSLDVSNNPIEIFPAFSAFEELVLLNLDNTFVVDLGFLQDSAIVELHISYTNVRDFEPLATCEKLECLYMYGYHYMDMTPLHQLPNFHSIYVSQGFYRAELDFMIGRFKMADKYTKVYLVLKNRGLKVNG